MHLTRNSVRAPDVIPSRYEEMINAVGRAERGRWSPADDLFEHRGEVRETIAVGERWKPVVDIVIVELGLEFPLDFGVHCLGKKEGGHSKDGP
jgi:hypothetical protein